MRQTVSIITKLIVVAFLFAILFSYAMFQGGFVSWFLFFSFFADSRLFSPPGAVSLVLAPHQPETFKVCHPGRGTGRRPIVHQTKSIFSVFLRGY